MKTLTKYLPDTLIIFGIAFSSYWFLTPQTNSLLPKIGQPAHNTELKVLGLVIFLIGLDIAARRIYAMRNNNH